MNQYILSVVHAGAEPVVSASAAAAAAGESMSTNASNTTSASSKRGKSQKKKNLQKKEMKEVVDWFYANNDNNNSKIEWAIERFSEWPTVNEDMIKLSNKFPKYEFSLHSCQEEDSNGEITVFMGGNVTGYYRGEAIVTLMPATWLYKNIPSKIDAKSSVSFASCYEPLIPDSQDVGAAIADDKRAPD